MPEDGNELGRQTKRLKSGPVLWIAGTVVFFLVVVAIMCFAILAPGIVQDSEVADRERAVDSTSSQLEGDGLAESSVQTRNDRLRQQTQDHAERYQMEVGRTINRSKATELKNERVIDINPQIDEFAQAREEWENLIGGLLVSDDGKRLAQDRELLEAFIELYSKRPMRPEWADAMREQLDILLQPVIDTIPQKFSQRPGKELEGEVRDVASTAVNNAGDIKRDVSILRGLVARAPTTAPENAPTLAEVIIEYESTRHSGEFLDLRNVEKQAEKEARLQREEDIREKHRQALAISEDLNERADELQKGLEQLAGKKDEIEKQQEKLDRGQVELEATQGLVAERKREIFNEMKQAVQYATPSRAELEASAKRGFAIASYLANPNSTAARRRGGVLHKQYNNGLIAPRGTEPCQIWKSADGQTVFIHSEGETLALSISDVGGIVYPPAPAKSK